MLEYGVHLLKKLRKTYFNIFIFNYKNGVICAVDKIIHGRELMAAAINAHDFHKPHSGISSSSCC